MKLTPYLVMVQVALFSLNYGITYAMAVRVVSATDCVDRIENEGFNLLVMFRASSYSSDFQDFTVHAPSM